LEGKSKKTASTKDSSKQSTLFGLSAPAVAEGTEKKSNRGRKRKSATGEEADESQNTQSSLASFLNKKQTVEPAETEELTQEETQAGTEPLLEETQPDADQDETQYAEHVGTTLLIGNMWTYH